MVDGVEASSVKVVELGTWRSRTGLAGESMATLSDASELYRDGNWSTAGLIEKAQGAKSLLVVEPSVWLPDDTRVKLYGAVMEEVGELESYCFLRGSVATSFAMGRVSASVLDVGHTSAVCSHVFDGFLHRQATKTSPTAGSAVSERMKALLPEQVADLHSAKTSLLSSESAKEFSEGKLELPDGLTIEASSSDLEEVRSMVISPLEGLVQDSFEALDMDTRKSLSNAAMLLTGGTSIIKGVTERVDEIANERGCHFFAPAGDDRSLQNWRGGSILASLSTFPQIAIARSEFLEQGSRIILSRCP